MYIMKKIHLSFNLFISWLHIAFNPLYISSKVDLKIIFSRNMAMDYANRGEMRLAF